MDVTAAVRAAVNAGQPFLGFRLCMTTNDRYLLGPPFTLAGSSLTVVPEPATFTLGGVAAFGGLAYGWRRRQQAAQERNPAGVVAFVR